MSFPFETMPVDTSFLQYVCLRMCGCLFLLLPYICILRLMPLLVQNMLHFAIAFKTMINNDTLVAL